MEQTCSTCRYYDLEIDAYPCVKCFETKSTNKRTYWTAQIEDITDPMEKLDAIAETQIHLMLEIIQLREELDKLVETVKERNKE